MDQENNNENEMQYGHIFQAKIFWPFFIIT